jgi:hypothetical protein
MLKKSKKSVSLRGMVVTKEEHEKWHKKNGSCGTGKEHDACMKKWGIKIGKK